MAQTLDELLRACCVQIYVARQPRGTGFFVAPELILTCAHVIEDARSGGSPIEISYEGSFSKVELQAYREVEESDLALLKLAAPRAHPCVLLHDGAPPRSPLYSYGYPRHELQGTSVIFTCEGTAGAQDEYLVFQQGQTGPGMSGAPLLNQEMGYVCGIIQFSRDARSDLGGKALRTAMIFREFPELERRQRDVHWRDRRWADLVTPAQRLQNEITWLPPIAVPNGAARIYYSYAPEDKAYCVELAKQLKLLKRQGKIADWYEDDVKGGDEHKKEARKHLEEANIILLLLSPNFVLSDKHYGEELKIALQKRESDGTRVIPIKLKEIAGWDEEEFGELLALPRDGRPINSPKNDTAWYHVATEIRRVVDEMQHPR